MKPSLIFSFVFIFCLFILSCKKKAKTQWAFERLSVDKDLPENNNIKLLSKYPELHLFKSEILESSTRTANIIQEDGYYTRFYAGSYFQEKKYRFFQFNDYKCKTEYKGDTLN